MPAQRPADDPVENQGAPSRGDPGQQPSSASQSSADAHPSNHAESIESLNNERYYHHSFLEKLLGLIANGENESVSRVVSVIRSGASHREILDMIDEVSEGTTTGTGGGSNGVTHGAQ